MVFHTDVWTGIGVVISFISKKKSTQFKQATVVKIIKHGYHIKTVNKWKQFAQAIRNSKEIVKVFLLGPSCDVVDLTVISPLKSPC